MFKYQTIMFSFQEFSFFLIICYNGLNILVT